MRPPARRPDPEPMRTDDRVPAAAGAACWAIALVVLLILGDRVPDPRWIWVCVFGIALGVFAVLYVPRLQRKRAEDEERRAANAPREN